LFHLQDEVSRIKSQLANFENRKLEGRKVRYKSIRDYLVIV